MKKFFTIFLLFLLFFLFIFFTLNHYSHAISQDLSNSFFRLHIIANSNSKEDQNLKLQVRDNIIKYMNDHHFSSKTDAINYVNNNLEELYNIAQNTIIENGYNYTISIEIGNFYFPTKQYGNIYLPAGNYDGIRIKIGEAAGKNWWCSLFPPLCFVDVSSGVIDDENLDKLKENLSKEEFNLIAEPIKSNEKFKFKFKIIEFFNK